jgi:hypothetical protein
MLSHPSMAVSIIDKCPSILYDKKTMNQLIGRGGRVLSSRSALQSSRPVLRFRFRLLLGSIARQPQKGLVYI